MSSALEEFRAQREMAVQVRLEIISVTQALRSVKEQVDGLAKNDDWVKLLNRESDWLSRATDLVRSVERHREEEAQRFWPGMWRRWIVAVTFALAVSFAAGSGYVWASRPYASELAELRSRVELLDAVAQRIIRMTTAERHQFDALMRDSTAGKPH